mmetsp:Transcript_35866/g.94259  ORF Transcript_35866/g.94259 Transcript_35866/m.94259 type:complete len:84 (-) Transcript_35866:194-445(-)
MTLMLMSCLHEAVMELGSHQLPAMHAQLRTYPLPHAYLSLHAACAMLRAHAASPLGMKHVGCTVFACSARLGQHDVYRRPMCT